MKKFIYLGGFPPPYGGVTIKNKLLYKKLSDFIDIEQSKFFNRNISFVSRIIALINDLIFCKKKGLIIGLSQGSLKKITYIMYIFNRKSMKNSIVMVMGGTFPQMVDADKKLQIYLKEYKKIYVETEGMRYSLNQYDINNVSVFPNCREDIDVKIAEKEKKAPENYKIRCLFFSLISKDKGADTVVSASSILSNTTVDYEMDFFGHIDEEYISEFKNSIECDDKLRYYGVFKADGKNDVYRIMAKYDVLLFPTKWKNEGVPGILVESKIAGIPAIVSDINFNSEIVEDNKTGIVLRDNTAEELADVIKKIYFDKEFLLKLKYKAKESSKLYLIENYLEGIIEIAKKID